MIEISGYQYINPCDGCSKKTGAPLCCSYITFRTPEHAEYENEVDLNELFWYLTRTGIKIEHTLKDGKPTLEVDNWRVELPQKCSMLDDMGMCSIYEDRPVVCSDHSPFPTLDDPTACERYSEDENEEVVFTDAMKFKSTVEEWFGFKLNAERTELEYDKSKLRVFAGG